MTDMDHDSQVLIMHADHQWVWLVHEGGLLSVWSAEERALLCEPLKCFNSNITYAPLTTQQPQPPGKCKKYR